MADENAVNLSYIRNLACGPKICRTRFPSLYHFNHFLGFLHLTVIEEDEAIIEHPQNVSAELGSTAYMTCKSHGNLRDHTSWVKLEEGDHFEILKEGSEVLEINNVTLESEGFYACVVGNSVASVVSYAYLTVRNTPKYIPAHQINVKVKNYKFS